MKKLVFTDNIGFDLSDWEKLHICKVFAGTDCIMAITDDGEVLQKTTQPSVSARTQYWTRIKEIALSKCFSGVAIGLVSDGTCMISKRAVRECDVEGRFDVINSQVKSWTNIIQAVASDAFFGLDSSGKVHYAPFSQYGIDDYRGVEKWNNVKKIVTGHQNSIFAITTDGKVLAEGASCRKGPHGDISKYLSVVEGVVDIFPTGSECEKVFMLLKDGKIIDLYGKNVTKLTMPLTEKSKVLDGTFYHFVLANEGNQLINICDNNREIFNMHNGKVVSFAAGDISFGQPFTIAVIESDNDF